MADWKVVGRTDGRGALAALVAIVLALAVSAAPARAAEPGVIATFHYTGAPQVFTVPAGVTYLSFDLVGGRGGYPTRGADPGPGGETLAGLDVTPGQQLTIWVGENAGSDSGWGYTCGGSRGIANPTPAGAHDGAGGGGSSAVTTGAWSQGAGDCTAATRPAGEPLIVAGGGGGGGGLFDIPVSGYAGGAGGNPAQPGHEGQSPEVSAPGGCVECGHGDHGGPGASWDFGEDLMAGGGGGGGGYSPAGNGGGGGGKHAAVDGTSGVGGAGGAGGNSFASAAVGNSVYLAGTLKGSGVVTISTVRQEGFECTGSLQHPKFPEDVQYAHVTVEGAAGGTRSGEGRGVAGKGGHGGIVSADLAGFAWDKLNLFVGCAGSDHGGGGGYGYGRGGEKGTANGEQGDDGSGGGGGSALEIGEFPVVVAGGGGGGGGGAGAFEGGNAGGNGGDGGPPGDHQTPGHDGETEAGGDGGCPGSEWKHGLNGANGGGSSTGSDGGGGGGGGGGWGGACGGEGGNPPNGGGGGGGGGGSYALPHSSAVTNAMFTTSTSSGSDGTIVFSYVVSEPTHISPAGGSGQQALIGATFAKRLVAQVVDQEGRPLEGEIVIFETPGAIGPSGTFPGGAATASVNTDIHGLATSPPFTATLEQGSWQATGRLAGVALPAVEYSLANLARPTATGLKATANPALAGEPVTFTATVKGTSGGPPPRGSVQFELNGIAQGPPLPLAGASVEKTFELEAGTPTIEAVFLPHDGFLASHAKVTEKVEKATSATKVTSSLNPSGFGEAVAFTAHVSHPGSHAAGGSVQFEIDGAALGAPVAVSGGTATSPPTSALAVAAHEVVAKYSGDEFVAAGEGKLTQSVGPDATATELDASINPSVFGQSVSFTATVKAGGADTPSGGVRFLVDGGQVCETTLSGGSASCEPATPLAPGGHEIRAEYAGTADFDPSHGTLTASVARAATATAVSADAEATRFGQPVSFSAAVSTLAPGGGAPSGEVQFFLGDQPLGAPVTINGGVASTPPLVTLPVGVSAVSARYLGDAEHDGSEETVFAEVAQGATTTTLASSANPTVFGTPVSFTATVAPSAPAGGEPGGTVRFSLDGSAICDVPVDAAGEARCQAPLLYAGEHDVRAEYSGEADFEPSEATLAESIVRAPSRTVASTAASPAPAGQAVKLSAEVVGELPGETPAGIVSFSSGSRLLGTAPVQPTVPGAGRAQIETDALGAGSHQVVARYGGDEAIEPSASAPITQVVEGSDAGSSPAAAAPACAARNVRARALVFRARDEVRLVARNRADQPAEVIVRFSDARGRGKPTPLGTIRHRFAGEGMFRVSRKLPAAEMRRLRRAGGGVAAAVTITGAPGLCGEESSRPLSLRRLVSGQRVWFQDDSIRQDLPDNSR